MRNNKVVNMSVIGTAPLPPMTAKEEDVMKEYASSLEDLTVNSKPLINMLTMLADENSAFAPFIVLAIERHLHKVPSDIKLPVLYLIDSIMKNVGKPYPELFTKNIVSTFCGVFEKVDEKTRAQMFKLRHTWNSMFPAKKMYALDARVNTIDPAWPITAPPPTTSIHLNPKFLNVGSPGGSSAASVTTTAGSSIGGGSVSSSVSSPSSYSRPTEEGTMSEAALRENLLKKKKELLELQQKKLELELLQTKKKLEEQEKQLEKTTVLLKPLPDTKPALYGDVSSLSKKVSKIHLPSSTKYSPSSKTESRSESSSHRKSSRQRKAAVAAAIAAAVAANSANAKSALPDSTATNNAVVTTVASSSVNITTAAGSAGSVPIVVRKTKPCAPVAPVVSATASSTPLPQNKIIKSVDSSSVTNTAPMVRIAPVSTQLVNAVRSRDPRLSKHKVVSKELPKASIASIPVPPAAIPVPTPHTSAAQSIVPLPVSSLSNLHVSSVPNLPPISVVAPLPPTPTSMVSIRSVSVTTCSVPISSSNIIVTTTVASLTTVVSSSKPSSISSTTISVTTISSSTTTSVSGVTTTSNTSVLVNKPKMTSEISSERTVKSPSSSPNMKSKPSLEIRNRYGNYSGSSNKQIVNKIDNLRSGSRERREKKYKSGRHVKKETEIPSIKKDLFESNTSIPNEKEVGITHHKKEDVLCLDRKDDTISQNKKDSLSSPKKDDVIQNRKEEIVLTPTKKEDMINHVKNVISQYKKESKLLFEIEKKIIPEEIDYMTVDNKDNTSYEMMDVSSKDENEFSYKPTEIIHSIVDKGAKRTNKSNKRKKIRVKVIKNPIAASSIKHIFDNNSCEKINKNISNIVESSSSHVVNLAIETTERKPLYKELLTDKLVEDKALSLSPKHSSPKSSPRSKPSKNSKSPSPSAVKNIEKIISLQEEKEEDSVPSPPSLAEVSDKFKDRSSSSIDRMKRHLRHRLPSVSPPPPSTSVPTTSDEIDTTTISPAAPHIPVVTGDTDLRVPPKEDIQSNITIAAGLESGKDVDLRALTVSGTSIPIAAELLPQSPKRASADEEKDVPPMKKSKMDRFDALFGSEDTDMRQELPPPLPSPPPPPIISPLMEMDENSEERSWAKYKQGKPDLYKSLHRHNSRDESSFGPYRRNRDRLGRPFLYHHSAHGSGGNIDGGHSRSGRRRGESHYDHEPSSRSRSHYNYILREAEEQFKSGTVSKSTYNRVITEVITMNEQKKLDEAIRRDEQENNHWRRRHHDSLSPGSAASYENNMNMVASDNEYEIKAIISPPKKSHVAMPVAASPKNEKGPLENKIENENIFRKPDVNVEENIANFEEKSEDKQLHDDILDTQLKTEIMEMDPVVPCPPVISVSDIDLRQIQQKPPGMFILEPQVKNEETKVSIGIDDVKELEKPTVSSDLKCKEEMAEQDLSKELPVRTEVSEVEEKIETDEKPANIVTESSLDMIKDEIDIEDDVATDNSDLIKEKQELFKQNSDIDSRVIPPPPPVIEFIAKENEKLPSLLPPPFPRDILQQFDDSLPQPPVMPDPAIIASKDTDLRICHRPLLSMDLPSVSGNLEPPQSEPMDTEELSETRLRMNMPDPEMEMEPYVPKIDLRNAPRIDDVDGRKQKPVMEPPRLYQPTKNYPRISEMETDSNQGRNSPKGLIKGSANIPTGPWDQNPIQNALPLSNVPGPGVGAGPWTRPLLRPPPALILQNRFNLGCWPNNMPMVPQNIQQAPIPQQILPPIRPPPPPPAGIFEPDVPGNVQFPQNFGRPPRFGPPMGPPIGHIELPPADPVVLDMIAADEMRTVTIDGQARDVRYYGDTAVAIMSYDEFREVTFQGPPKRVTFNDKDSIILNFNEPFREVIIDGKSHRVKFGGPTRELHIDNSYYEVYFGGPPVTVEIGGKMCKIQLEGPAPQVRVGNIRRDLVAGKVNLIIDGKHFLPIFLDPKPQRFDIDGVPHIFRFVEALETLVINGVPMKVEFGGLPKPIYMRGKKHFIRLTSLPAGIMPGYVNIINMEGGRRGSPPPLALAPPPMLSGDLMDPDQENSQDSDGPYSNPVSPPEVIHDENSMSVPQPDGDKPALDTPNKQITPDQPRKRTSKINPLDVLTSLIAPTPQTPSAGYSYSVEPAAESAVTTQSAQSDGSTVTTTTQPAESKPKDNSIPFLGQVNVDELFQKLIGFGMVPGPLKDITPVDKKAEGESQEKAIMAPVAEESNPSVKPVDFRKPETLKIRQPGLISILFSGIQCSSCGVRFPPEQTMKYSQHLDWHFRQNRRDRDSARKAQSRKWYYDISDWIQFEEIEDLEERAQSWFESQAQQNVTTEVEELNEIPSVPCENGLMDVECEMCKDKFEQFYNEEKEEWHLRRAVKVDDKIYHPICYEDYLNSLNAPPTETDETKVEEEMERDVEVIPPEDEDDDVIIQEPENKPIIIELIKDDDEEEEEREAAAAAAAAASVAVELKDDEKVNVLTDTENISSSNDETSDNVKKDVEMDTDEANESGNKSVNNTDIDKDSKDESVVLVPNADEIQQVVKNIKQEQVDDIVEVESIIDLEHLVIKKEKIDEEEENLIPKPVVDTTHSIVACSIDGNVELDEPSLVLKTAPSKIKINISKAVTSHSQKETSSMVIDDDNSLSQDDVVPQQPPNASAVIPLNFVEPLQPPPPGEEPGPLHLKPRLVGKKLKEIPPVSKGTELSGLCSIM